MISIMLILSAIVALLLTSATAFTVPSLTRVSSQECHHLQRDPSVLVLNASRSRQKVASRTKWAETRGCAGGSSDDTGGSSAPRLIIAGAPASGKGTQCELIKDKFGVVHLSTGDMLRAAVAAGTDVGKKAKDFMDAGKLVPDEVIIGVVS